MASEFAYDTHKANSMAAKTNKAKAAYTPTAAPLLVKTGMPEARPDNDAGMIPLAETTPKNFVAVAGAGWIWDRGPFVRSVP